MSGIAARFTYFVDTLAELPSDQRGRLDALLLAGEAIESFPSDAQLILTAPRPGTISPWSSKATDIAQACHLDQVRRIERGITALMRVRRGMASAGDNGAQGS